MVRGGTVKLTKQNTCQVLQLVKLSSLTQSQREGNISLETAATLTAPVDSDMLNSAEKQRIFTRL
jgi:hypothetical protein